MGVTDKPERRQYSHPQKFKEVYTVLPQFTGVPVYLLPFQSSHDPTGLYNDCKGSEADCPHNWSQISPMPGRLAYLGSISGRSTSEPW